MSGALTLAPATAGPSSKDNSAKEKREDAQTARHVRSCARPALSPSVRLGPASKGEKPSREQRIARAVAGAGRVLQMPARAQALAISAVLAGDLDKGEPTKVFFKRLQKVDGWETLPPSIAVHRVLGTPDPFRYEERWGPAVKMLASFSPNQTKAVESLVSAGGRSPSRCYASASDASALPLPPGTSFQVKAPEKLNAPLAADVARPRRRRSCRRSRRARLRDRGGRWPGRSSRCRRSRRSGR